MYLVPTEIMILAFDVYYTGDQARAVCIAFTAWPDTAVANTWIEYIPGVPDYEPGAFYKRELPCILAILNKLDLSAVKAVVIDGYVILDDAGKPGLGTYLYNALGGQIPVIGVAKTTYANNDVNVTEVRRGQSERPLYVTAIGTPREEAAEGVRTMAGEYRIPTLLKHLDSLTRNTEPATGS